MKIPVEASGGWGLGFEVYGVSEFVCVCVCLCVFALWVSKTCPGVPKV